MVERIYGVARPHVAWREPERSSALVEGLTEVRTLCGWGLLGWGGVSRLWGCTSSIIPRQVQGRLCHVAQREARAHAGLDPPATTRACRRHRVAFAVVVAPSIAAARGCNPCAAAAPGGAIICSPEQVHRNTRCAWFRSRRPALPATRAPLHDVRSPRPAIPLPACASLVELQDVCRRPFCLGPLTSRPHQGGGAHAPPARSPAPR